VHNLLIRKDLCKTQHIVQISPIEAPAVISGQLLGDNCDDLFPVFGSLLAKDVCLETLPNSPVKPHEFAIDRDGRTHPTLFYDLAQISEQGGTGLFEAHAVHSTIVSASNAQVRC